MNSGTSSPLFPLEGVVTTDQLLKRPGRPADLVAENHAMQELAKYLADRPSEILQKLAEAAMTLCNAGSAGVSILEEENDVFRWHGAAGQYAAHRWGTLPRYFSPCGTVIDSAATQLMFYPEKHFSYLTDVKPAVVEVLLIPFSVNEKIVGTVWIVSHDTEHRFDSEDVRIVTNLATFAAAGYQVQMSQKSLETSIRNRDEFLAVLGHELRNSLAPLVTVRSLLLATPLENATQRPAVEILARQLTQMQRLVDDILDVSRISEGKISIAKTPTDIGELVKEAIDSVQSLATQSQLRLHVAMPQEPIYIDADRYRIVQIINNLLNNAIKFTPKHGEVTLEVKINNDQVCIFVRDTGIGLAPDNLQSIFTMFAQIDNPASNYKAGLGIGLGLAKTLTELHGGTIGVQSAGLNQGCEFVVRLPILKGIKQTLPQPPEKSTTNANVLRILVADDHQDGAESLGALLRILGHDVRLAPDGLSTVKSAAVWHPHVVLLDLDLPGLNGYDVIQHLRLNPATRHCVVMAVTGYNTDADRTRTKEHGFDLHLAKPIDVETLRKVLDAVVIYDGSERRVSIIPYSGEEKRRAHLKSAI